MSRARRLEPIRDIARETERTVSVRVAALEQRLASAQQREHDLRQYRSEYQHQLSVRAGGGLSAQQLCDFQTFLARLTAAIEAQQTTVAQLRLETETVRSQLRQAMIRQKSLGTIIERVQGEERRIEDRRLQRDADEHAQRMQRVVL